MRLSARVRSRMGTSYEANSFHSAHEHCIAHSRTHLGSFGHDQHKYRRHYEPKLLCRLRVQRFPSGFCSRNRTPPSVAQISRYRARLLSPPPSHHQTRIAEPPIHWSTGVASPARRSHGTNPQPALPATPTGHRGEGLQRLPYDDAHPNLGRRSPPPPPRAAGCAPERGIRHVEMEVT
jgi:hypothetical protein